MTDPLTTSAAWQRGAARAIAEAAAAADQQPDETPEEPAKRLEPLPPVDLTLDPVRHWTNWPNLEETS